MGINIKKNKMKLNIIVIIIFFLLTSILNIFSYNNDLSHDIYSNIYSGDFYESINFSDDKKIKILFDFKKNSIVKIIEKRKTNINNYFYKYKIIKNEIWIYLLNAKQPIYILRKENNKFLLSTDSSLSSKTDELKRIRKNNKCDVLFISVTGDLRLRDSPNFQGIIIRKLLKDEILKVLDIYNYEIVNGKKGLWVKVETEKGEIGWCFDAYLEEIKE